ncbi:hypothetical protein [Xenorhabdus sp. Sc-CR9]|uniref:hypothetical protein n=1 Tax=Xenorhabdus sp. Sc-CR9 TaxID=2584468 RepID=UPI001F45E9E8|nr:hypothetical protein [Xenorhabdus sp. Sc-CR9]
MPDKNNKMEISIITNADLVIGQYVSFVVTLSSDKLILPNRNIIIKNNNSNNIKFDEMIIQLVYDPDSLTASQKLGFTVLKEVSGQPIKDGSLITFDVTTDATAGGNGFAPVPFTGKANEIDPNTLSFFIEKPYLQVLPDGNQPTYTAIHTTLRNKNTHKELIGTPVFITSLADHKMKEFIFKDAKNTNEIIPEKVGPNEGLNIASDNQGVVKFYLYPKLSLVNILELRTIILNTMYEAFSKKIYVVNYSDPGYMNSIGIPSILGYDPSGISANGGVPYFLTSVDSDDNELEKGDMILFFVNDHYIDHAIPLVDPQSQLDQYTIQLPYSIFIQNELSQFSYTVIKPNEHALYSDLLPVTYLGGIPYEPDPKVERGYNTCIVHTSLGVGSNNIIPPSNWISPDSVMQYPEYKHDGLFIEIVRSDIHNPKATVNPVPLNITDITLIMYINSENKNFQKLYTKQITLNEIGGTGGNANSIFFNIPYKDVTDIRGNGSISFDYQFYLNENLQHSVAWNGLINTVN